MKAIGTCWTGAAALLIAGQVLAQEPAPPAVRDLVGARAAGGETQLQARGYVHVKTQTGSDRKFSNWWNASTRSCLSVVTREGRYSSIISAPSADCGQGGPGGAAEDVPVVSVDRFGEGKVTFANGCVVSYNVRGQRVKDTGRCRPSMLRRADEGMAAYRREQQGGAEAPPGGFPPAGDRDVPTISVDRSGEGKATFANGCVVFYSARGNRTRSTGRCTPAMLRRADEGMAGYRREQQGGAEAPPGGFPPAGDRNVPTISVDRYGEGKATFANGCVVSYNVRGDRIKSAGRCTPAMLRRADQGMAAYRREQ